MEGFGNIQLKGSPVESREEGCHPNQIDQMTNNDIKEQDPRSKATQDSDILMSWKQTWCEGKEKTEAKQTS